MIKNRLYCFDLNPTETFSPQHEYMNMPPPINSLVTTLTKEVFQQHICRFIIYSLIHYSWFVINLSGCGGQCQPPTLAGSDNEINNIFLCVVPPTWPP